MAPATHDESSVDVLVVGGGLAGLAAATYAARRGASVTLLEKGRELGGRASTQTRDGFSLNQGAHALYRSGIGHQVLRELGVKPEGGVPSLSGGYAIAGGDKHTFPGGFLSLLSTSLLPWSAKMDVAKILATLPRLDTRPYERTSVSDTIAALTRSDEARDLLHALVRLSTYGNDPERQSGGDALAQLQLAFDASVLYVHGGWSTIVEALREAATEAGVDIRAGDRAESVAVAPSGIEARTGSRTIHAGAVVLATGPREAADLTTGDVSETLRGWASEAAPAYAACLDVCLDELPAPRATFALGVDQPIYLSVHSAVSRLAPEGKSLVHCMKYLGPRPSGDPGADERELEGAMDLLQPGWRAAVAHTRFLPKMLVTHGVSLASAGGAGGRPGPSVPRARNVFVAGDWVGPEGMLADASLASGRRAGSLASAARIAAKAA